MATYVLTPDWYVPFALQFIGGILYSYGISYPLFETKIAKNNL
jgi:hypothetical protein